MKKIIIAISLILILLTSACTKATDSVSTVDNVKFIDINNTLSYDTNTKIVYIRNHVSHGFTVYTHYLTVTGVPYQYDIKTNQLKEIKGEIK